MSAPPITGYGGLIASFQALALEENESMDGCTRNTAEKGTEGDMPIERNKSSVTA
jgi:hypothetical protein